MATQCLRAFLKMSLRLLDEVADSSGMILLHADPPHRRLSVLNHNERIWIGTTLAEKFIRR